MVKIDSVNGQNAPLPEKTVSGNVSDGRQGTAGSDDSIRISEEGKKKRVMGHVLASLSGPDTRKV